MAVPKRRTSPAKRDMRRAANVKIVVPNLSPCPKCSEPMVPHRVCAKCGFYKGRKVTEGSESENSGE